MYQSKNCGHGFDLYMKCQVLARSLLAPMTPEGELRDRLEDMTGETYVNYVPTYCPICGKKVEEAENE